MAHFAILGAGDGIDNLRPVQGKHLRTSGAGRPVLDGLVLHPLTHDLRCDAALFWLITGSWLDACSSSAVEVLVLLPAGLEAPMSIRCACESVFTDGLSPQSLVTSFMYVGRLGHVFIAHPYKQMEGA